MAIRVDTKKEKGEGFEGVVAADSTSGALAKRNDDSASFDDGESGVEDGGEREEQRFIHDTAAWKMGGGNGDLMSGALAAAFR